MCFICLNSCVAEPHYSDAVPVPGLTNYAAPTQTPKFKMNTVGFRTDSGSSSNKNDATHCGSVSSSKNDATHCGSDSSSKNEVTHIGSSALLKRAVCTRHSI
jgi:hypothetical protein